MGLRSREVGSQELDTFLEPVALRKGRGRPSHALAPGQGIGVGVGVGVSRKRKAKLEVRLRVGIGTDSSYCHQVERDRIETGVASRD